MEYSQSSMWRIIHYKTDIKLHRSKWCTLCVCMLAWVDACRGQRLISRLSPQSLHLIFWDTVFTWTWNMAFQLADWPVSPWDLSVSTHAALMLQATIQKNQLNKRLVHWKLSWYTTRQTNQGKIKNREEPVMIQTRNKWFTRDTTDLKRSEYNTMCNFC